MDIGPNLRSRHVRSEAEYIMNAASCLGSDPVPVPACERVNVSTCLQMSSAEAPGRATDSFASDPSVSWATGVHAIWSLAGNARLLEHYWGSTMDIVGWAQRKKYRQRVGYFYRKRSPRKKSSSTRGVTVPHQFGQMEPWSAIWRDPGMILSPGRLSGSFGDEHCLAHRVVSLIEALWFDATADLL
ncbi:hypothetical protein AC579_1480 [Pseudocercospora musae]|uniref:Uncharacterized protein n=1 Tax=Pseudocercospora musae TaxID=113226 RepID=A0A139I2C4_9PEZI|nr:hypothetical protein AC579_1480 [Pseudocercospora musae]